MRGTYYKKDIGKWCAQISVKGRKLYLGAYDAQEDAHQAYLRASNKYAHIRTGRTKKVRWYAA